MRRFIITHTSPPSLFHDAPKETRIEGVQFSDGFIVIHGGIFEGVHVKNGEELHQMFRHDTIEWLDKESKS